MAAVQRRAEFDRHAREHLQPRDPLFDALPNGQRLHLRFVATTGGAQCGHTARLEAQPQAVRAVAAGGGSGRAQERPDARVVAARLQEAQDTRPGRKIRHRDGALQQGLGFDAVTGAQQVGVEHRQFVALQTRAAAQLAQPLEGQITPPEFELQRVQSLPRACLDAQGQRLAQLHGRLGTGQCAAEVAPQRQQDGAAAAHRLPFMQAAVEAVFVGDGLRAPVECLRQLALLQRDVGQ